MVMALCKRRNWWLLALAASARLGMAQMDHDDMDHGMDDASSMSMTMSPSSTESAPVGEQTHTVTVGFNGHSFKPNNTKARTGDTIEFHFLPTNHSVVRAENMWPCVPIEEVGNGKEGFFSGFFHVGEGDGVPKWRYTLANELPIFYYSSAGDDCNRFGMVGGINAKQSDVEHQYEMALDSQTVGQPDAAWDQSNHGTSTTPAPTASSSAPPSAGGASEGGGSSGIGGGAIAGIVVGAVAGIAAIAGLFYWYGIIRARQKPPTVADPSPMTQSSYLAPGGGGASSFDARSGMFSSNGVPSPPPATLGLSSPEQTQGAFVDGDTIYVPVKRSTIAVSDMGPLPAELYNPGELYHPGVPTKNSDTASWSRGFEGHDNGSVHHTQTPTSLTPQQQPPINNRPSELSG